MNEIPAQGGMGRLTLELRERLQEMTAAAHALAFDVAGNERALGYLAVLNRAICAQLRLIRQIELDGRLNSPDEIRLQRSQVDLVALCQDVMKRSDSLTRPLLDIRAEFSSPLTTLVTCADRNALEAMLLCFITNAVQAIGRGGSIRLGLEHQEEQAVFTVTDSGGGLDPAALAGLFDTWEEQDHPVRGLLLGRRIAELHGGALMADNTEDGGARLTVSIPITEQEGGALRGQILRSKPIPADHDGGWDSALVALSGCLPPQAFAPHRSMQ